MFLAVHAVIGATLGEYLGNPLAAFVLGFISHFIGDIIPHGDEQLSHWMHFGVKRWRRLGLVVFLDLLALVAFGWIIFTDAPVTHTKAVWTGFLGSILPDILWVPHNIFNQDLLKKYARWHNQMHKTIKRDISFGYGLAMQGAVLIGLYKILF